MKITDQLGRIVTVPSKPNRIISLCPSETETLAALVDKDRIIGCTDYCLYPAEIVKQTTKLGGTKKLDLDTIHQLNPDLIIAVKEENDREQIDALSKIYPVLVLDPFDHDSTLESISMIGKAVREEAAAHSLNKHIQTAFNQLHQAKGQRVLYLIWRKPYMAAGQNTYIHSMLDSLGFTNAAAVLSERYPILDEKAIKTTKPQLILAASEPFPFSEKHRLELETIFPNCPIYFVSGEHFGWHGVRILQVSDELNMLIDRIGN